MDFKRHTQAFSVERGCLCNAPKGGTETADIFPITRTNNHCHFNNSGQLIPPTWSSRPMTRPQSGRCVINVLFPSEPCDDQCINACYTV